MRNLGEVVDRLMAIIPEEETALRHRLKTVAADRWKPPEQCWLMGGQAFYDRFGEDPPTDGWGKRAVDIWMGRDTDDETDGLGGAIVVGPPPPGRTDWWLVATLVVLALLGAVVYLRAHR